MIVSRQVKELLDEKYLFYDQQEFIESDPISIPHSYKKKQDVEIAAFFAALLAWGQRKTIINKCKELMERMDNAPYEFLMNASEAEMKNFLGFKHRTFNEVDALYFIDFLQRHYKTALSLEEAFLKGGQFVDIQTSLTHFNEYFFENKNAPDRTRKHVASPAKKSACKRLNMFLRWMVRKDEYGVDFGLWNKIPTSALICPLDVHVERVGRKLNLFSRKQTDWLTALELTESLKSMDDKDPVKYDFALFGLGIEKFAE